MQSKTLKTLVLAAALAAFGTAQASNSFWFVDPNDASGTALTSLNIGTVGSTFNVAVWYSSDVSIWSMEMLVGYDHSTTEGTSATPLDGKLGLAGTPSASVTMATGFSQFGGIVTLGGGLPSGQSGSRNYGVDAIVGDSANNLLAPTAGAKLLTISMKNTGLGAGQGSDLVFHVADATVLSDTTYLVNTNFDEVVPTTTSLHVQSAPEPTTVAALGLGLLVAIRRKSKRA